jgi:hypothetical protein
MVGQLIFDALIYLWSIFLSLEISLVEVRRSLIVKCLVISSSW